MVVKEKAKMCISDPGLYEPFFNYMIKAVVCGCMFIVHSLTVATLENFYAK